MLTYYFDRRDRRRDRQEERVEVERACREDRSETEQIRREDRAEAERRHQEMMTTLTGTIAALTAVLERNGHGSPDHSATIEQLQQRIAELEAEISSLRNGDGDNPTNDSVSE